MRANKWKSIGNSIRLIWEMDRMLLMHTIAASVIGVVVPYIGIFLSAYVLDGLQSGEEIRKLLLVSSAAVAVIFLLTVLESFFKKCKEIHTDQCGKTYDTLISMKTISMDYPLLNSPVVHEIRAKIVHDNLWGAGFYSLVWQLPELLNSMISIVISAVLILPLFIGAQIFSDVSAVFLIMVFIIMIGWNVWFASEKKKEHYKLLDDPTMDQSYLSYFLWKGQDYHYGKDVRIYQAKPLIENKMRGDVLLNGQWMKKIVKNQMQAGFSESFSAGILQVTAYLFVALRAAAGALTAGAVVKYAGMIYQLSKSVSDIFSALEEYAICSNRQLSTLEYLKIPDVLNKGTLPVEKRAFCDGGDNEYEIEFRNVSFRYPGSDAYALRHISLKLHVGKRMAVVGRNGSGKTTFIKLLCRLYDPTEGEICLNGIDIKKYDYEEYLSIFSVVFQDFKLFSFGLGQNVAANVDYDQVRVNTCLKKAGIQECPDGMPEGLDTCLYKDFEENGVEISGGESQKIALARALYKDAPFMILDEPTAALDPVAEYEVYSKFNEIVEDKTVVYISHRLSSCRFCDEIIVFHEGQMIQRGKHEELVSDQSGIYSELWNAQAQYYGG